METALNPRPHYRPPPTSLPPIQRSSVHLLTSLHLLAPTVILLLVVVLPPLHWTSVAMVSACVYILACRSSRSVFCLASRAQVLRGLVEYAFSIPRRRSTFRLLPLTHTPVLTIKLTGRDHHMAGLIRSLHAAQIDPAIETISGSPMTALDGKYLPHFDRHVDRTICTEAQISPSKTGRLNRNTSTNSSSSTDRVKDIRESPNWRNKDGNFVRRSGNQGDDPFVSSANAGQSQGRDKSSFSYIGSTR